MPRIQIDTKVAGAERFAELSRRLEQAGRGDLQRKLADAVQREGRPALEEVRRAWLGVRVRSVPSRGGGKHSGLRARTAAATQAETLSTGVRVRVDAAAVDPAYGNTLTRGLDGQGRWRHPVFGNRKAWVAQFGQEVFYKTLQGHEARWRLGIERAMDEIAQEIGG